MLERIQGSSHCTCRYATASQSRRVGSIGCVQRPLHPRQFSTKPTISLKENTVVLLCRSRTEYACSAHCRTKMEASLYNVGSATIFCGSQAKGRIFTRLCPIINRQSISIYGYGLRVAAKLHGALPHLRDRLNERIIWVDAIGNNQKDKEEPGMQVLCICHGPRL
jgi:hypothetical protein